MRRGASPPIVAKLPEAVAAKERQPVGRPAPRARNFAGFAFGGARLACVLQIQRGGQVGE